MKYWVVISILSLVLTACTISVTQIHSEGSTDTLDEQQTAEPDIQGDFSMPALGKARDTGLYHV